jgi:adenine deaminase
VLQAACINPVKHYNLQVGCCKKMILQIFIVVGDLEKFNDVLETYISNWFAKTEKVLYL